LRRKLFFNLPTANNAGSHANTDHAYDSSNRLNRPAAATNRRSYQCCAKPNR
jgi:hypothetical protein